MNEPYNAYQPYQRPYQQTYQPQYQQGTNTIFWVQGEEGAKNYLMAPNTVAWLMDRNEPKLYVKRTDSMGQAYPLERMMDSATTEHERRRIQEQINQIRMSEMR